MAGIERQYAPDRTVDDVDDPDLGAAAMEDAVVGDSAEPGGSRFTASFEDWPDEFEAEVAPRRQPAADQQGAGSSVAPAAGGAQKRRAALGLFGSRPKKSKPSTAATKRDEAAAKAARFRKAVKQPQAVSA